jgi:hypothetical protein
MKICHVAHGVMPIPPPGWGAVEALVWEYKRWIERLGHEFYIVNTKLHDEIISQVAICRPDVVHVHCEHYFGVLNNLDVKVKIACSHLPWLYEKEQRPLILREMNSIAGDVYICCLTDWIKEYLAEIGFPPSRLFIGRNGANPVLQQITEAPRYPTRSIFLATVDERKRQYLVQDFDFIDFVGPKRDETFDYSRPTYLGEWTKDQVHSSLTDYANLVLLSRSEAAPLVVCEALMSGLGLVISESASGNLDLGYPFIDVIPEDRINDKTYLEYIIKRNQGTAAKMRMLIRQYAERHFSWDTIIQEYISNLERFKNIAEERGL